MYGAQAGGALLSSVIKFENDVEMYGAQAAESIKWRMIGLRMM